MPYPHTNESVIPPEVDYYTEPVDHYFNIGESVADGRYSILEIVSQKPSSAVYKVFDWDPGTQAALKVHRERDYAARKRVTADFAAQLALAGTAGSADILDMGIILESPLPQRYRTMAWTTEGTLDDYLVRNPASVDVALNAAHGILPSMVEMDNKGIVHTDITPRNILSFDKGKDWKLTDFGLAGYKPEVKECQVVDESTPKKVVISTAGTLGFMAPELFTDPDAISPKTDLYSFAITIFAAASRTLPFKNSTVREYRVAVVNESPAKIPRLRDRNRLVPMKLDKLIFDCMSPKPDDRPDTTYVASELAAI